MMNGIENTRTLFFSEFILLHDQFRKSLIQMYQDYSLETTCHKGCAACCHMPIISCTVGEAYTVYHLLLQLVDINLLQKIFFEYTQQYFFYSQQLGSLPFTRSQRQKFLQYALPCPLLRKENMSSWNGVCSIYPERPLICEAYHSLSPASFCETLESHAVCKELLQAHDQYIFELQNLERKFFQRTTLGHLPLFLAAFILGNGESILFHNTSELLSYTSEERDFLLYKDLLSSCGYTLTEQDINSLLQAQSEVVPL